MIRVEFEFVYQGYSTVGIAYLRYSIYHYGARIGVER